MRKGRRSEGVGGSEEWEGVRKGGSEEGKEE